MRHMLAVVTTVLCLLLVASNAHAQRQQRHEGFWIGFGIGGGANLSRGLDDETSGGGAAYLRLGGTLSQKFLLGGEILAWGRQDEMSSASKEFRSWAVGAFWL